MFVSPPATVIHILVQNLEIAGGAYTTDTHMTSSMRDVLFRMSVSGTSGLAAEIGITFSVKFPVFLGVLNSRCIDGRQCER